LLIISKRIKWAFQTIWSIGGKYRGAVRADSRKLVRQKAGPLQ